VLVGELRTGERVAMILPMMETTALDATLARHVVAYSERVRDAVLAQHPGAVVCSPLGVWLLLCACLSAAEDAERVELEAVVGCSQAEASELLGVFVENVPPAIRAALAVWARDEVLTDQLSAWRAGLPAAIDRGPIPTQAAADAWAKRNTLGLIREFPIDVAGFDLVLASALATRVSWQDPYEVAAASEKLAPSSPWAGAVERVLWTDNTWRSAIVETAAAGLVAVHQALAREGLVVICVSADPAVPRSEVLAAAHEINQHLESEDTLPAHSLFDIALGDGHSWTIAQREREAQHAGERFETITDIALPAWEIRSELTLLASPAFGATAATRVLHTLIGDGPSDSRQVALARFDRFGFEAAAVTGISIACSLVITNEIGVERTAGLRFDHPFAAIAVCRDRRGDPTRFRGLPVFEAWIHAPTEVPADNSDQVTEYHQANQRDELSQQPCIRNLAGRTPSRSRALSSALSGSRLVSRTGTRTVPGYRR
jgi:hypothetical protein